MNIYDNLNPDIIYFMYSIKDARWSINEMIDFYALVFILDGDVTYQINNETYKVSQGDVVFMLPNTSRIAFTDSMRYVAIDFILNDNQTFTLPTVTRTNNIDEYIHYFKTFNDTWLQHGSEYKLQCKGLLLIILYNLLSETTSAPKNFHVEAMKRYIIRNYLKPITVDELACHVGLNPVYCGALFKKFENCTISYYINTIRITQAKTLMDTTNLSLSEIAYQTGFNDIYYFSKTFKNIIGVSPSAFRKQR